MATYSPSKITKDGNTYNFTDATKIPLSGTNALAGSIVPSTDNSYDFGSSSYKLRYVYCKATRVGSLNLDNVALRCNTNSNHIEITGGTDYNSGPSLVLTSYNSTEGWQPQGSFVIHALTCDLIGKPDGTLTWNGSTVVVSSDRRIKDEIESIPDEILDAWENLEPKQYKYKSDLENDKENAQTHYGWIAQDVESIIKGDRKGEVKNGLWLHEQWEEQEEVSHEEEYTEEVETKSGEKQTVTKTRKVIDRPYKAKGDSYGLRYTECLVVECKYLRRCIERLTARIEQLEKGNNVK